MLRLALSTLVALALAGAGRSQPTVIPFWPAYKGDSHIVVGVRVNGHGPYPFVLDSCSNYNLIDGRIVADCGLSPAAKVRVSAGGKRSVQAGAYLVDRIDVGGARMSDNVCVNVQMKGFPFRGILGVPFLRSYVVQVDFDRRQVVATPYEEYAPSGMDTPLPLDIDSAGLPTVHASLEGRTATFLLDTGNAKGLGLHAGFVQRQNLNAGRKSIPDTPFQTVVGLIPVRCARFDYLQLGPYQIHAPVASIIESVADASSADGNIGIPELRRFRFTLDLPRKLLYLDEGSRFAEPLRAPRSGIVWQREHGVYIVEDVVPGSPAAQGGMMRGDALVRLNGVPVTKLPSEAVFEAFMQPAGTRMHLTIRRQGSLKDFVLTLRDLI